MSDQKQLVEGRTKSRGRIKSIVSSEVIATGGGIIGLFTLVLLIYQNILMANQTAEMHKTNSEMVFQRQLQQKQRFNHLIEILYAYKFQDIYAKTSYKRDIKKPLYISKLRTEAFHEMMDYLRQEKRVLDFSGGALCQGVDFRDRVYDEINLEKAELQEAILSGCSYRKGNFKKADFFLADLSKADFLMADFEEAILFRTNLGDSKLAKVNFQGTVFREANLAGADLSESNLSGAYFVNVDLRETVLTNATYDSKTVWPDGFDLMKAHRAFNLKNLDDN